MGQRKGIEEIGRVLSFLVVIGIGAVFYMVLINIADLFSC
jgi:hypothetical protein